MTTTPPIEGSPRRSRRKALTTPPPVTATLPPEDTTAGAVVLAAVAGAHGVVGEVRLKLFTDDLSPYTSFNDGDLTLRSLRPARGGAIARFAEVSDRAAAEALRGTTLTVPRNALPALAEDEYYHADLIGLAAVAADGTPIGVVVAVDNFGAGDVVEIERASVDGRASKRFMVPMRAEAVPEWGDGRLVIAEGWAE